MTDELRAAAERVLSNSEDDHWLDFADNPVFLPGVRPWFADAVVELASAYLAEHPADDDESCTCPTLDGVQVTGSACPVHGLPQSSLGDMTDDEPVTEEWLRSIGFTSDGRVSDVNMTISYPTGKREQVVLAWATLDDAPPHFYLGETILWVRPTRGQVRRLIEALGGETT